MGAEQALLIEELTQHPVVLRELDSAWQDSLADDPQRRHEEGGWIYQNPADGSVMVRRAPTGQCFSVDLGRPPIIEDWFVIATFHTHPHPSTEGWYTGASQADTESAFRFGVPCVIRADDGIHVTGPSCRRGGLAGESGYPA